MAAGIEKVGDLGVHVADAVVGVDADLVERGRVFLEDVAVIGAHAMAKHDRVGNLHHRRFEMKREQHPVFLRSIDFPVEELSQ